MFETIPDTIYFSLIPKGLVVLLFRFQLKFAIELLNLK